MLAVLLALTALVTIRERGQNAVGCAEPMVAARAKLSGC